MGRWEEGGGRREKEWEEEWEEEWEGISQHEISSSII